MTGTARFLAQLAPAALLIWIGWGGVTSSVDELPNSLLKIPLFVFGVAWVVFVAVAWIRRPS